MIVAYALPVIEEAISSTYREAEISSESKMCKDAMMEEMSSLHKKWYLAIVRVAQRKEGDQL